MSIKLTDLPKVDIVPLAGKVDMVFECGQKVTVSVESALTFSERLFDAAVWANQLDNQQAKVEDLLAAKGAKLHLGR